MGFQPFMRGRIDSPVAQICQRQGKLVNRQDLAGSQEPSVGWWHPETGCYLTMAQ